MSMPVKELLKNAKPAKPKSEIDYYPSARSKECGGRTTLIDFIEAIRSNEYEPLVSQIRDIVGDDGDPTELKKKLKKKLPAVSLSGKTKGRRRGASDEGRFLHSGYLQVDLDAKDNPSWSVPAMRQALMTDDHIQAVFISASGQGVKGIARIPADVEQHKASFLAAEAHFAEAGLVIDKSCKDPVRLCFVSHDPEAWLRDGKAKAFEPLDLEELSEAPVSKAKPSKSAASLKIRGTDSHAISADDIKEILSFIPPTTNYDEWVAISAAVWSELGEAEGTALLQAWNPERKPGEYAYKFKHRLKDVKIGTLFYHARLSGYVPPAKVRAKQLRITEEKAAEIEEKIAADGFRGMIERSSRGAAEAFAEVRFGEWAYVHDECGWRRFMGGIWERDGRGEVIDDLQTVVPRIFQEAVAQFVYQTRDDVVTKSEISERRKQTEKLYGLTSKLYSLRYAKEVEANAAILEAFRAKREDFDNDPKLMVIENGTLNFESMQISDHDPSNMATVRFGFHFDPDATCPAFDTFMREFTCGDSDLEAYLWRFFAYACTGDTHVDTVPFLYGSGANGKSTLIQTFQAFFRGFARTLDVDALLADSSRSDSDYKKATLEGIRLAVADELPSGRRLNSAMLKRLVGGDTITARQPHERVREFKPTHKLLICGNHKPTVKDCDEGTWRRLHLVPCNASFVGRERNRDELVAEFVSESAGILNRILAGYADFKANWLSPPPCVVAASNEYRDSQDQVRMYSDERLKRMEGQRPLLSALMSDYHSWCSSNGEDPVAKSARKFGEELRRIDWITEKGGGNRTFVPDAFIIP